jgi:hypothetical protein
MNYSFSRQELKTIFDIWQIRAPFGPSASYRQYHKMQKDDPIRTEDVEDFSIAFMTQYNREISEKF